MSPVFDCTTDDGRREGVAKAVDAVRAGQLVVLPTDTLYGVGCDAFDAVAVASLLGAKGRGREMPPPVLVPDARTVDGLATEVPAVARDLIAAFWPGPLTIILKAQPSLHWDLGETNGTVAVRMPDNDLALDLLREIGPMAVSSANRTGYPAARDILDAATQLGADVQVYLDSGRVKGGLPSTIVDCTGDTASILRLGALGEDDLEPVLAPHAHPAPASPPDDGLELPGSPDDAQETSTDE
ncbi:MAG: L-threonylcarbamoyladenylate synthase [Nostocoides sp.]